MKTITIEILEKDMSGKIVLRNKSGDTFTCKSEELNDFISGCESLPTPPVQEPIAVNKENKRALRIAKNILVKNRSGSLEDWIKNIIDGLEEYKSSAPAPEITNEMKPVYNNAELKLKILLDNGIEFDRIGYSVKAVDENSLLAAMEEYRQQSSFGYSYEDMMDIAGWMAAADNKKPIHELKEEAENYIKTKKEYRQQGQGVDEKEVCNLLAAYSKELASIEELGDKGRIQIRHAKEIIKYFASHPTKH